MNILLNKKKIEELIEFIYLGSEITKDGNSKRETFSSIGQAQFLYNSK